MDGKLIDTQDFRNRHGLFSERMDAGKYVANMLMTSDYDYHGAYVLAIPSGGVPVAIEIARMMDLPLDLIITRKLQIPGNTEAGFGAMTMNGTVFYNQELLARLNLSEEAIEKEKAKVKRELERRNARLRSGNPAPDLSGKTAILVDDGIASGFTMLAAIDSATGMGASAVHVAVPTAPRSSIHRIAGHAERIYCANVQDSGSFAVAAAYRQWRDLASEETENLVRTFAEANK